MAANSLTRRAVAGPPLRRSLWLITVAWLFGSVWLTAIAGTPQTNYAKSLRASEFQFGLMSALPFIASLLSLPASMLIEATGQRKQIFLCGLYLNRIMWFPIALIPLWLIWYYGINSASAAMASFLWLLFIMHLGQTLGGPAWTSWMADVVPERVRGKYFSRRRAWGIIPAIPAGLLVGYLLDRYANSGDPLLMLKWCAGVFIVAAFFGIIDIHLFHYVPDVPRRPQTGRHLLRAMREPLHNRQFLWMCGFVGTLVFAMSFMGQFVTKYVMEQLAGTGQHARLVNLPTQLMLIVVPNIAVLLVINAWGKAADRMGKKPLLVLAALGLVPVGLGWCLVSRELMWLGYVLSALGVVLWAGVEVANFNLVLDVSGSNDRNTSGGSAYVAVNAVVINIAGMSGGLAAGLIAQWLEHWTWQPLAGFKTFTYYDVLFALSAMLRLAAVAIFLPRIHEPEARPTHETLRFMTANVYNNLFNAIAQPLRFLWRG